MEEIRIEEERKQEEERKVLEEIKKEEERKLRAKSRFTEIKEVAVPKPVVVQQVEEVKEEVMDDAMEDVMEEVKEEVKEESKPKQESYLPQNVPLGSTPLRVPAQFIQADVIMKPDVKVAPTFTEAATEDTIQTHALKTESAVLNERLDELEKKRLEIEAREQAHQKQAKLEDYTEEDQKITLEKVKKIYFSLPKDEDKILEYPLNWDVLYELNVIDGVMHRIVSKRVKKILHVEEPGLIS
jgi:hypothetical protein